MINLKNIIYIYLINNNDICYTFKYNNYYSKLISIIYIKQ